MPPTTPPPGQSGIPFPGPDSTPGTRHGVYRTETGPGAFDDRFQTVMVVIIIGLVWALSTMWGW